MADDDRGEPRPFVQEGPMQSGAPQPGALVPGDSSVAVAMARVEIDTQIATARAYPRSIGQAVKDMTDMATISLAVAEDCIYSLPRGGKQIRGPSIRFAEIVRSAWGHSRDGARVVFVDRLERVVECEGVYHDLQKNIATTTVVRRTIELKKNKSSIDLDMIQLAGAAGMSIARRNAILGGVPRPVWEPVLEKVEQVIRGDAKTLGERRDRAIAYFAKANIGVDRLLKSLAKPSVDDIDLDDLMTMNGWRVAITQGDSSLDEIFPEERKPGPKNLSEQLDALAGGSSPTPPVDGEGEGSTPSPIEGGSSNPPEGAAAPGSEGAAASSDGKAARKPASGPDRRPARQGPAAGKTPASGPPRPADAATGAAPSPSARDALAAKGSEVAAKGHDALMEWLDNLSGDQVALITPLMEKLWHERAEQSGL
jgi:hypothetical protein